MGFFFLIIKLVRTRGGNQRYLSSDGAYVEGRQS